MLTDKLGRKVCWATLVDSLAPLGLQRQLDKKIRRAGVLARLNGYCGAMLY
ncbi:MAG: hypothetical protein ACI85Z_001140 [Rheinheimera aquimaris]|jgi:hypothetical protein